MQQDERRNKEHEYQPGVVKIPGDGMAGLAHSLV
jgi:hypothetical protein